MISRKDFIINALRGIALLALASTSGFLIFRDKNEEECDFEFLCEKCSKLNSCSLKQAMDYKNK